MKSRAYQTTPTPVLDLLPSLLTTKTNRPHQAVDRTADCRDLLQHGSAFGFIGQRFFERTGLPLDASHPGQ